MRDRLSGAAQRPHRGCRRRARLSRQRRRPTDRRGDGGGIPRATASGACSRRGSIPKAAATTPRRSACASPAPARALIHLGLGGLAILAALRRKRRRRRRFAGGRRGHGAEPSRRRVAALPSARRSLAAVGVQQFRKAWKLQIPAPSEARSGRDGAGSPGSAGPASPRAGSSSCSSAGCCCRRRGRTARPRPAASTRRSASLPPDGPDARSPAESCCSACSA